MKVFKTANTSIANYLSVLEKEFAFSFLKNASLNLLLKNPIGSNYNMLITAYTINNNSSNPLYMDVYENPVYSSVLETFDCVNKSHYSDFTCPFDIQGVDAVTGDLKLSFKFQANQFFKGGINSTSFIVIPEGKETVWSLYDTTGQDYGILLNIAALPKDWLK